VIAELRGILARQLRLHNQPPFRFSLHTQWRNRVENLNAPTHHSRGVFSRAQSEAFQRMLLMAMQGTEWSYTGFHDASTVSVIHRFTNPSPVDSPLTTDPQPKGSRVTLCETTVLAQVPNFQEILSEFWRKGQGLCEHYFSWFRWI
jgi:hypothetical protein